MLFRSLLQERQRFLPRLQIASFGQLKIRKTQFAIGGYAATHHCEIAGVRCGPIARQHSAALNAMIRYLLMGDVSRFFTRHVATAAVRRIGVVLAHESRRSMAGEASASKVAHPLFRGRGVVRIMASSAGKPIPTLFLARALQKRFPLAGCSALRTQLSRVHEMRDLVREILTRSKRRQGSPRKIDRYFSFKMTLQTYRVSLSRG